MATLWIFHRKAGAQDRLPHHPRRGRSASSRSPRSECQGASRGNPPPGPDGEPLKFTESGTSKVRRITLSGTFVEYLGLRGQPGDRRSESRPARTATCGSPTVRTRSSPSARTPLAPSCSRRPSLAPMSSSRGHHGAELRRRPLVGLGRCAARADAAYTSGRLDGVAVAEANRRRPSFRAPWV